MSSEKSRAMDKMIAARRSELAAKRKQVLALSGGEMLDAFLESPDSLSLVRSFSEEDLFLIVHEIGVEDALPVIEMASDRQWEHILDREIWTEDRISSEALTRWMGWLVEASPRRLIRWMTHENVELLEFYLMKYIDIRIRVHDQDPSELGDGFSTHDDVYYTRSREYPFDPPISRENRDLRDALMEDLLGRIAETDFIVYQKILLETPAVLSAEMEEELYRRRNTRMAEKGFVPPEEAVGVYRPLSVEALASKEKKRLAGEAEYAPAVSTPLLHAEVINDEHVFSHALALIDSEATLQQLQTEFAGLCNRIISADRRVVREREELKTVVVKACGYVQIGMEALSGAAGDALTTGAAAKMIRTWPVENLFRVGFGKVLEIEQRTEKWLVKSWMKSNRLSIRFWDEQGAGYLGGALLKRPLFFDNYRTGVIYRDFQSMADVRETMTAIDEIIAYDGFFNDLGVPVKPVDEGFLTFRNFLLTLWARDKIGSPMEMAPVPLADFKGFLARLFEPAGTGEGASARRVINQEQRRRFLSWLSRRTGRDEAEISRSLGHGLESLFNRIEQELGQVSESALDARFIHLFFVEGEGNGR